MQGDTRNSRNVKHPLYKSSRRLTLLPDGRAWSITCFFEIRVKRFSLLGSAISGVGDKGVTLFRDFERPDIQAHQSVSFHRCQFSPGLRQSYEEVTMVRDEREMKVPKTSRNFGLNRLVELLDGRLPGWRLHTIP